MWDMYKSECLLNQAEKTILHFLDSHLWHRWRIPHWVEKGLWSPYMDLGNPPPHELAFGVKIGLRTISLYDVGCHKKLPMHQMSSPAWRVHNGWKTDGCSLYGLWQSSPRMLSFWGWVRSKIHFFTHIVLKPSVTKISKNWDNGSPCVEPLLEEKKPAGLPFTKTEKLLCWNATSTLTAPVPDPISLIKLISQWTWL